MNYLNRLGMGQQQQPAAPMMQNAAPMMQNALGAAPGADTANLADIMRLLQNRSLPLGARESSNVQDERNFANEPALIRGNAQLASEIANLYAGLKYYMNKMEPPVSMQEIGDLLPNDRLGGFAAPMMGTRRP